MNLNDLNTLILREYPEFEDTTLFFLFRLENHTTEQPRTDMGLQVLLSRLAAKGEMTVRVVVTTPEKAYSDWTLPAVKKTLWFGNWSSS